MSAKSTRELIHELAADRCVCGRKKMPRRTFCGPCYYAIPQSQRLDLYRRAGEGYEEAYARAFAILVEHGRVKPASPPSANEQIPQTDETVEGSVDTQSTA